MRCLYLEMFVPNCLAGWYGYKMHSWMCYPVAEAHRYLRIPWSQKSENKQNREFYVHWTVHHLDIWIKRDQLDVTCFIISLFNTQHVSDVNTSILRSLRLICWVISWVVLFWFDVCWCYVVVWLWWCGIRMQAEALVLQLAYGYHTTIVKPQRNTNTHWTRAIQPMK